MKFVISLVFALTVLDISDGIETINNGLKLMATNGTADDSFGYAVNINRDTIVVGSLGENKDSKSDVGAIRIYSKNGSVVKLKENVTPNDGQARDQFGHSVASNGKYIIVGSVWDHAPNILQGSAYLYNYDGRMWVYKKIVAEDGERGNFFGQSVAINEKNEAVVGANGVIVKKYGSAGSAYVFTYNGTEWTQRQKLTPSDLHTQSHFGWSVAMTTSHIAVGARWQFFTGIKKTLVAGAVYMYKKNITGTWFQQAKLFSPNPQDGENFGYSVSMYDGRVVIGAYGERLNTGKAYVYVIGGNTWVLEATLTSSDRKKGDGFGRSVAIHRDIIVIGAYRAYNGSGCAYAFKRVNGKWMEMAKLVAGDAKWGDSFGESVSIFNSTVTVGSPGKHGSGASGATYVFNDLRLSTVIATPKPTTITKTTITSTSQATGWAGTRVNYILWFVFVFLFFFTTC